MFSNRNHLPCNCFTKSSIIECIVISKENTSDVFWWFIWKWLMSNQVNDILFIMKQFIREMDKPWI